LAGKYDDEARLREQVGLLIRALRADLQSVRESAIVQLSLFGGRAVPHLSSALVEAIEEEKTSKTEEERSDLERAIQGIIRVLGMIADSTTPLTLVKALPRPEAVMALGKVGTPTALNLLIQEIPTWYVPEGTRGSEREQQIVSQPYWWFTNYEEQEKLVRSAFSYFGREAVTKMSEAARDGSTTVCLCACVVLQEIGGSSAIAGLLDLLENLELRVRTSAFHALLAMGAPIPQEFVRRVLEGVFKHGAETVVDVPLDRLLEASQGDTLLLYYFDRDWVDSSENGAPTFKGSQYALQLLEFYIAKNGEEVKPKLIEYVQSGTLTQQRLAARLLERVTSSVDLKKPVEEMPSPLVED
jgi:hypothetical protein